jgi:hypothetical protein
MVRQRGCCINPLMAMIRVVRAAQRRDWCVSITGRRYDSDIDLNILMLEAPSFHVFRSKTCRVVGCGKANIVGAPLQMAVESKVIAASPTACNTRKLLLELIRGDEV